MTAFYSLKNNGLHLHLHIQPRASRTAIVGLHGDRLKIALHSPPVDGKANAELQQFMAKTLKVSKSSVQIISGDSSKQKELFIQTDDTEAIIQKIQEIIEK